MIRLRASESLDKSRDIAVGVGRWIASQMEKRGFLSIATTNEGDRYTTLRKFDDRKKMKRPISDAR